MSKYGHRSHNWFEAIVNKLGGEEAAERFLRGELVVGEVVILYSAESCGTFYYGTRAALEYARERDVEFNNGMPSIHNVGEVEAIKLPEGRIRLLGESIHLQQG